MDAPMLSGQQEFTSALYRHKILSRGPARNYDIGMSYFPDSYSPPVRIIQCSRQVFQTRPYVRTELF